VITNDLRARMPEIMQTEKRCLEERDLGPSPNGSGHLTHTAARSDSVTLTRQVARDHYLIINFFVLLDSSGRIHILRKW